MGEDRPSEEEKTLAVVRAEQAARALRELAEIERDAAAAGERLTAARVELALDRCLEQVAATGLVGEANRLASTELWRIAGPVLAVGWLQNHARTKPRGYAGDHEMLAKIAAHWRCDHPLGRHFDHYFQSQAAPEAVRARIELAGAMLAEGCERGGRESFSRAPSPSPKVADEKDSRPLPGGPVFRVASIGSGPALDIVHAAKRLPTEQRARFAVTLLDLDDEALRVAAENLAPWFAADQVTPLRTNLFRLAQRPKELGGPQDAILCTGLFDYLDPPAASGLMRALWETLAPGGWMIVGNFAAANPTRAYMEWIGNWYLKYRTADELAAIAEQAGIPRGSFQVATERTGVNLLLQATK